MSKVPDGKCGYTWPENHEIGDDPDHQSCCYRDTDGEKDLCAWHSDPEQSESKTVEDLTSQLVDSEIRKQTRPVGELLDGAELAGVEIGDSVSLQRVALRRSDLTDADLQVANLTDTYLKSADFTDADLVGVDFTDADALGVKFTTANLRRADLNDAFLSNADLTTANLRRADLTDALLSNADLTDADLGGANLTNATLFKTDLTNATLFKTDLTDVSLRKADLTNTNLRRADLTNADLREAHLTDATLANADFSGANLQGLNLSEHDLSGVNLSRADLRGVDMIGMSANQGTTVGRIYSGVSGPDEYDKLAQAYHELKEALSQEGLSQRARQARALEQQARTAESWRRFKQQSRERVELLRTLSGWRQWWLPPWPDPEVRTQFFSSVGGTLSRFLTGYGTRPLYVLIWTAAIVLATTALFALGPKPDGGWEGGALYYSVVTFVTAPPAPPGQVGTVTRAVVLLETYLGTALIVLLGYVLGTHERV